MKKIDDSKLYLYFGIASIIICILLAIPTFISKLSVEPKIEKFLSAKENLNDNFKQAYLILRNPHIFAGYDNFDYDSSSIKKFIIYFDSKIQSETALDLGDKQYLEVLLDRRKKGSKLGENTLLFFSILTILSWGAFFYEKKKLKSL